MRKIISLALALFIVLVTMGSASAKTNTAEWHRAQAVKAAAVAPQTWDWGNEWSKVPQTWDWSQNTTLHYGMRPDGTWVPLNPAAEERATATPLNVWKFYRPFVGDPICLKDYTPETTWWSPQYAASEYSSASGPLHMYWDDMNSSAGTWCSPSSYDDTESIHLRSYDDPSGYCSEAFITRNANNYVLSANVWLNRGNAPDQCDGTSIRRTHVMKAAVGYALGLAYHNIYNNSIMSVSDWSRANIHTLQLTDHNALRCKYDHSSYC